MSTLHKWIAVAAAGAIAAVACGDDSGAGADARPDGPAAADTGPDAFNPCPGMFTFEALVTDFVAGTPVANALVEDAGGEASTTSAPNGRAVLCTASADAEVVLSRDGYLPTRYTLGSAAAGLHAGSGPFPAPMITADDADDLLSSVGATRDPAEALVAVEILSYPGGGPATGAAAHLGGAGHLGPFVEDTQGDWMAGGTLTGGSRVLFANVPVSAATTPVSITPAGGSACQGPAAIAVAGGALAYTLFGCD